MKSIVAMNSLSMLHLTVMRSASHEMSLIYLNVSQRKQTQKLMKQRELCRKRLPRARDNNSIDQQI